MRKIALTVLFTLYVGLVFGQEITFHQGEKTNGKAFFPQLIRIVEGMQEGQLLVVEPELKAVSGPFSSPVKAVTVRLCDTEWKDAKKVTLADTKGDEICEAFRTDNRLHVLVSHNDKKALKARHVVLDAQTLDIVSDDLLVDFAMQKGDEASIWVTSSPNGLFHGIVYVVWSKNGSSSAVAQMYDKEMNKLWQKILVYSEIYNVMVNNDGVLATMRLGTVENNNDVTAFRLNLLNADSEKHGEYILNADVSDLALLNCDERHVLAVTLEGKGGYGILRIGTSGNRSYTGVYGLVFDLDEDKIAVSTHYPFADEDIALFFNASRGQKSLSRNVDYVHLLNKCSTLQGGAALYQRAWKVEVRRNGTSSETVHSMGILMVQANMNGDLTINHIPQCNQNADWPRVGADIFPYMGKVYVVTNESKRETDEYTPNKPAQPTKSLLMANTALAVYWFTPDGQGAKKVIEREKRAIMDTPLFAGEGNRFYLLTSSSNRPHISSVTIPANQ